MNLKEKKRKLMGAIDQAQRSLVYLRENFLENDPQLEIEAAEYHHRWSDQLLFGEDNEAWEGFRGSGKTQYILRAFPLHRLMFPTEKCNYIVIIKGNATQSAKELKEISREYQKNPVLSANLLQVIEDSGEVFHIKALTVKGEELEVRIEAYGKGQAVRGIHWGPRRPNIIIIDDPQDREDARSEVTLEADWEWFLSDILFLGNNASSRIFIIGNNLGEKCIVERIIKNKNTLKPRFVTEKIPRIIKGKPAWPQRDKIEDIEALKESFEAIGQGHIFYEEVMCESMAEEMKIFKDDYYRYFSPALVPQIIPRCSVFATLDWAVGKDKRTACYRAICVNAVTPENYWNILKIPFGFWDPKRTIDEMFAVVAAYKEVFNCFGIEKGIYKEAIEPFVTDEMIRRKIMFRIVPIEHARVGSKLERVKMLQPRFQAHQILFPQTAEYNAETKTNWLTELKHELGGVTKNGFKSAFTDLMDALAMQDQIAEPPIDTNNPGNGKNNQGPKVECDAVIT